MVFFFFKLSTLLYSIVYCLFSRMVKCPSTSIYFLLIYCKIQIADREPPSPLLPHFKRKSLSWPFLGSKKITLHSHASLDWESSSNNFQYGSFNRALYRFQNDVGLTPRVDCRFGANFLCFGSHTTQIFMGIPLEVRMAHFRWSFTSKARPKLYFDIIICLFLAFFSIFDAFRTVSRPLYPLYPPSATWCCARPWLSFIEFIFHT